MITELIAAIQNADPSRFTTILKTTSNDELNEPKNNIWKFVLTARLDSLQRIQRIEALVQQGLDVNLKNQENKSPLYIATEKGLREEVKYLLANGAEVNAINSSSQTTALHAATLGTGVIADLLVKAGAILMIDSAGRTPLDYAITFKKSAIIALLEKKSSDSAYNSSNENSPDTAAARKSISASPSAITSPTAASMFSGSLRKSSDSSRASECLRRLSQSSGTAV